MVPDLIIEAILQGPVECFLKADNIGAGLRQFLREHGCSYPDVGDGTMNRTSEYTDILKRGVKSQDFTIQSDVRP